MKPQRILYFLILVLLLSSCKTDDCPPCVIPEDAVEVVQVAQIESTFRDVYSEELENRTFTVPIESPSGNWAIYTSTIKSGVDADYCEENELVQCDVTCSETSISGEIRYKDVVTVDDEKKAKQSPDDEFIPDSIEFGENDAGEVIVKLQFYANCEDTDQITIGSPEICEIHQATFEISDLQSGAETCSATIPDYDSKPGHGDNLGVTEPKAEGDEVLDIAAVMDKCNSPDEGEAQICYFEGEINFSAGGISHRVNSDDFEKFGFSDPMDMYTKLLGEDSSFRAVLDLNLNLIQIIEE